MNLLRAMQGLLAAAAGPVTTFASTVTWSARDISSRLAISNGNRTVTKINGNLVYGNPRCLIPKKAGKYYCEIFIDVGTTSPFIGVGLGTGTVTLDDFVGRPPGGWSYYQDTGAKYTNNTPVAFGAPYTTGDVIGIAYDATAGMVWFSKNNVWQASGDPANGINPAFSGLPADLYPMVSLYREVVPQHQATGRFQQSDFSYSPPSGFLPWNLAPIGTDPFFTRTTALLHFDGANGSITFTDVRGNVWTVNAPAQISTTNPKFGTGCGLFTGGGAFITSPSSSALFSPRTGDWTVEMWVRFNTTGTQQNFFEINNTLGANPPGRFVLFLHVGEIKLFLVTTGGVFLNTGFFPVANIYYHIAVSKSFGSYRCFVDGVQVGATTANAGDIDQQVLRLGSDGSLGMDGRIDDFRFTPGVARYTANFTPPTAALPDTN